MILGVGELYVGGLYVGGADDIVIAGLCCDSSSGTRVGDEGPSEDWGIAGASCLVVVVVSVKERTGMFTDGIPPTQYRVHARLALDLISHTERYDSINPSTCTSI